MEDKIIVYGTSWCGGSRRAKRILDENKILYRWIDIDQDKESQAVVEKINNGFRSVPTILFRMVQFWWNHLMKYWPKSWVFRHLLHFFSSKICRFSRSIEQ